MKNTKNYEEIGIFEDVIYFNSTKKYTLSLLNALNGVPYFVNDTNNKSKQRKFTVPITFGSYEKSQVLEDLNEDDVTKLHMNYFPRLVLSFEGMTKAPDRQTQKFQMFSRPIEGEKKIKLSYNSQSYDFNYTLLLQARGLTSASQITEIILAMFNPSYAIRIQEFPFFDKTETQILISDPQFEILDEFAEQDINIINVSFDIVIRGNIYSPIKIESDIRSVKLFMNTFNDDYLKDQKMASYFSFDNDPNTGFQRETAKYFKGTAEGTTPIGITERVEYDVLGNDYHGITITNFGNSKDKK